MNAVDFTVSLITQERCVTKQQQQQRFCEFTISVVLFPRDEEFMCIGRKRNCTILAELEMPSSDN